VTDTRKNNSPRPLFLDVFGIVGFPAEPTPNPWQVLAGSWQVFWQVLAGFLSVSGHFRLFSAR
jgi:hypothetical protein